MAAPTPPRKKLASVPSTSAATRERLARLEAEVDTLKTQLRAVAAQLTMALIQQQMQNPEVQQAMLDQLIQSQTPASG